MLGYKSFKKNYYNDDVCLLTKKYYSNFEHTLILFYFIVFLFYFLVSFFPTFVMGMPHCAVMIELV